MDQLRIAFINNPEINPETGRKIIIGGLFMNAIRS